MNKKTKSQIKSERKYTKSGYLQLKIPTELYSAILEQKSKTPQIEECHEGNFGVMNCAFWDPNTNLFIPKNNTFLFTFQNSKQIQNVLNRHLKPILEGWTGVKLFGNGFFYGIRRYLHGSVLWEHVDKIPTHIISAILQIDQKVNENWPLLLTDHFGQKHKIVLKPGEMLLYESATVPHGRQFPLNGDYFDNLFMHYQPVNQINKVEL